jgi:hypothetical protein
MPDKKERCPKCRVVLIDCSVFAPHVCKNTVEMVTETTGVIHAPGLGIDIPFTLGEEVS